MIFEINGEIRYAYYSPVGINDWYIIVAVDKEDIAKEAQYIRRDSIFLAIIIISLFIGLFTYMIVTRMKTFKQYAKRIYRVAYYDELTGLPNLIKFKEEVNELLTKNPNEDYVCIAFDIRNFKMINSIYGSDVGDKVLIKIAQLVSEDIKIKYTGIKSFTRAYADTFMIFSLKHEIPVDSIEQKGITEVFEELKAVHP